MVGRVDGKGLEQLAAVATVLNHADELASFARWDFPAPPRH
jgi:hypothetical protein